MDFIEELHDFGATSSIKAESIGEPGHRTFCIIIESGQSHACLWLEKEQLYQLAIYMRELVLALPFDHQPTGTPPSGSEPHPNLLNIEFTVGKLSLNADPETHMFHFSVHDIDKPENSNPTLGFDLTKGQTEAFSEQALTVCAAGRPTCPLCSQPINPEGHNCPKANGHAYLK